MLQPLGGSRLGEELDRHQAVVAPGDVGAEEAGPGEEAVAMSVAQLSGWPSMRITPPRKISTTIRTRNVAAIDASAAQMPLRRVSASAQPAEPV